MLRERRELFPCEDPGEIVNLPFTKTEWLYHLWGQRAVCKYHDSNKIEVTRFSVGCSGKALSFCLP